MPVCGCLCCVPRAPSFAPASLEPEGPVRGGPASGCGLLGWCSREPSAPTWAPCLSPQHPRGPCLTWLRCGLRLSQHEGMRPTWHLVTTTLSGQTRAGQRLADLPSQGLSWWVGGRVLTTGKRAFQEGGSSGATWLPLASQRARLPSGRRWVPQGLGGAAGSCQSPPP